MDSMDRPLYIETPLLLSSALSQLVSAGRQETDEEYVPVFLKMETCQPTGSFKMRGVSCKAQQAVLSGSDHLVTASGGNAGLATARAAKLLHTRCTVFVPRTTGLLVVQRLRADGATVVRGGENYNAANKEAMLAAAQPGAAYVSAYDQPEVWTGNASLVTELKEQLNVKPGVVIVSVGGGGLLAGVLEGLDKAGWSDVPVIAMETQGAHCFNLSVKAGELVALEKITSIAVTLGARTVTPHLMTLLPGHDVISEVVSDAEALTACLRFADDQRALVEPSCGAALAAVYGDTLRRLRAEGRVTVNRLRPAVVVVCGGSGVTLSQLQGWAQKLDVPFPVPCQ